MPRHVRLPSFDSYDGRTDPKEHIAYMNALMDLYAIDDDLRCLILPTTLKGEARRWHSELPPNSIQTYQSYCGIFTRSFIGAVTCKKHLSDLVGIRQGQDEPLKEYARRFNEEALLVREKDESSLIAAFVGGVRPGTFNIALQKQYPTTMNELMQRTHDEIRGEESNRAKRAALDPRKRQRDESAPGGENKRKKVQDRLSYPRNRRGDRPYGLRDSELTPLNTRRQDRRDDRRNDRGRERERDDRRPGRRNRSPEQNPVQPDNQYAGVINVISGGPTAGDSGSLRKSYARAREAVELEPGNQPSALLAWNLENQG